jgi:hypothetical protein
VIDRSPKERWHVGKEIPLALIMLILAQTATGIWWAATQTAKLDTMFDMVKELRQAQYTQNDARRDMEINTSRYLDNQRRISAMENMLNRKLGK